MSLLPQPARADIDFIALMHALADPVRLRMVGLLADGRERTCLGVVEALGMNASTMSHHFRVLRESGVTSTRKTGRVRYVTLRRDDLDARFPGVLDAAIGAVPA
ncbi:ArsR/SmtB family transcription factor [Actinomadura macrotermitis]|uniref:HTH arsR-type domain-containing protein n=1 Tax=Actinomadura macrotermitis TaxID=2585200 RepID=A0A7K0BU58_9ACTN|nr:metalloregulator ArsR/SmtB family transcription factor [Actinomadura macrotermitis]MQY04728.1 hypothetical protein [Actinomadura macrotermitis]